MVINNRKKIVIIGAGISGLTAAFYLEKYGFDVIILEKNSKVGGRMATFHSKNYTIDTGAQFLSSGYKNILNLIEELSIKDEIIDVNQNGGIIRNNRIYSLNYHNPFSIISSGFLSFKQFISLAYGSYKLKKVTKQLSPSNYSDWHHFDNENAQEWSDEYYGNTITEYLIEPTLEAFYFQSPIETSKALPIALSKYNNFKTITLKSGIDILPTKIAENLKIELNKEVLEIIDSKTQIEIVTMDKSYFADYIIIATTADIAKNLYKNRNSIENKLLETKYSSTINIAFGLKNKLSDKFNHYGIFVPRKERKNISAIAIESNKHSERVKEGDLINVMLSGKSGKNLFDKSEKEIVDIITCELNEYIPNISKEIVFSKLFKWRKAEPFSSVGRSKNINEYRKNLKKENRILLVGDYMGMPFTEGAVETGVWIAKRINKFETF